MERRPDRHGPARLEQAWLAYLVSVRRHLVGHFSGQNLTALTAAFQHVATSDGTPT